MISRKNFLRLSLLGSAGLGSGSSLLARKPALPVFKKGKATVISTWWHGQAANRAAWQRMKEGGNALDAAEAGVMVTESDATGRSVGLGGLPDRDGFVTLDACIMDSKGRCGAVAFLQNIEHPISVARKVMEETPHVMLVGEGAYRFAKEQGFPDRDLLVPEAKEAWEKWKLESKYEPEINRESHDTIGLLALDHDGNLAGSCTTSGMAYKMHGRVGDSPIIGSGLFVDNEVGAACATGLGEAVIRVSGSHLVVELMRQGYSPQEACKEAVDRIIKKEPDLKNLQVCFIALNKAGEHGAHAIYSGFSYALTTKKKDEMVESGYEMDW